MPQHIVLSLDQLDSGWVLAPERYDQRRRLSRSTGTTLGGLIQIVNEQVSPRMAGQDESVYTVLDTGDANEGVLRTSRAPLQLREIGSAKKRLRIGDVIISRLRPYLRQVALVDAGLFQTLGKETGLACSTEFFVLRSQDPKASIAFLVPYLLSTPIQRVLAAAQEGGHHPRFSQATLEQLRVPDGVLARRSELSVRTEESIRLYRTAEQTLRGDMDWCGGEVETGNAIEQQEEGEPLS